MLKALGPATNVEKGSGEEERVMDEEEVHGGAEREGTLFFVGTKEDVVNRVSSERTHQQRSARQLGKRGNPTGAPFS